MSEVKTETVKVRHVMHYDIDSILSLHKRIGVKESNIAYMISSGFGGPMDFSYCRNRQEGCRCGHCTSDVCLHPHQGTLCD